MLEGMTMFYAAGEKGNSKAMSKSKEAAYSENSFVNFSNSNQLRNNPLFKPSKVPTDLSPRYVRADTLNMRTAPGKSSEIIDGIQDKSEVWYTGNKTKEIDGHLWAEVYYNGKVGWVAADYLRIAKPDEPKQEQTTIVSSTQGNTPRKPNNIPIEEPKNSLNSPQTTKTPSNANATDPYYLQKEFQNVGDFDGAYGLQCPDITSWYLSKYTTLSPAGGNGCEVVSKLANKHKLPMSFIPSAPAIYSVAGKHAALGTNGNSDSGHTGIILSVKDLGDNRYEVTYIYTYNALASEEKNSSIKTETITPDTKVTFVNLSDYLK